jgi:hypothetical protein
MDDEFEGLPWSSPKRKSDKYAKNGEEMMDILVDDIDRYEQLSNREELLTLVSALAGNGAEQDSSAQRQLRELIMASFKEYLNQLCFDCISRLFERKCGADLSWYRFVLIPNCLFQRVSE